MGVYRARGPLFNTTVGIAVYVQSCCSFPKAKGQRNKKQYKTKLFPPTGPLEDIAIDFLRPLPKTRNENEFTIVIIDRYSKLTRPHDVENHCLINRLRDAQSLDYPVWDSEHHSIG